MLVDHVANADKVQTFQLSIEFLVAVVIGGTATVVGPLLGAWLVVFLQHWIADDFRIMSDRSDRSSDGSRIRPRRLRSSESC